MAVIHWEGRDYLRVGECNHCGECCNLGTRTPCPYVENRPDYTSWCRIYDRRGEADDPQALNIGILTTGCVGFPANPGDLRLDCVRNRCGYQFLECPKILVASCTHQVKEYAWERWSAAVKTLTYPNLDVLVVDNSPDFGFYERHRHEGLHMVHIELPGATALKRINWSMEVIRQIFLDGPYDRWMNIEADIIVPPDLIEQMLLHCPDGDWISHAYPIRNHPDPLRVEHGIGCSLLRRAVVESADFHEAGDGETPDGWLWERVAREGQRKTFEIYHLFRLEHLAGPGWENG